MLPKLKVLFLCTGNSCRSRMAEGWTRFLHGEEIEAYSAGTRPAGTDPLAVRVMSEKGVDLSGRNSRHVDEFKGIDFDLVVTVCDGARQECPLFPGESRMLHAGFDDPPHLAAAAADENEAIEHYRRVRDEIRMFIEHLPALVKNGITGK